MSETSIPPNAPPASSQALAPVAEQFEAPADWQRWAALVLSVVCAGAAWTAWNAQQRVKTLEQELVRRQQESQGQSTEASILARQAQELSREAAARTTLLETRLAEVALQRSQVEDLIKSLSLSRDENLVVDIDATLRVAIQQSALTGGTEPLMNALQSADERIAHAKQPRLDQIRRAIAKDLDRVRTARVAELSSLTIRLDEAIRMVDEAPLINQPHPPSASNPAPEERKVGVAKPSQEPTPPSWSDKALQLGQGTASSVWAEMRGLLRVTRIARPEAMLISPEQSFFLRENLKLRLLNARLALLSRQNASAVADINMAQTAITRYFDQQSRKTQLLQNTLADVETQSPQTLLPRPDDTLAALAAIAGRSH